MALSHCEPLYLYQSVIQLDSQLTGQQSGIQVANQSVHQVRQLVSPLANQSQSVTAAAHRSPIKPAVDYKSEKDLQPKESLDSIQASLWSFLLMTKKTH